MNDFDVATAVAKGVALLDEKVPGWLSQIDVDSLDLSNPNACVLGQVFEDFTYGAMVLSVWYGEISLEHGYDVPKTWANDRKIEVYRELTAEWKRVITILQAKPSTPKHTFFNTIRRVMLGG